MNYKRKPSPLERDYIIEYVLEKMGMNLMRFWQEDIKKNLKWVSEQIITNIDKK
jgi:very-short-patch-repair endonuclease